MSVPAEKIAAEPGPAPDLKAIPRITVQAFCETRDVAATLEAAAADRRMSKAHVKVQMGGLAAGVEFYQSAPTPNLVIVESKDGRQQILDHLDGLAEVCDPGTKVVVVGHVNDVLLYRELTRRGVSEYVVAPFDVFDVIREIGEIFCGPEAAPLGRTIAFVGAKGGCGASTIAHNVAWSIGRATDQDVVLSDLDFAYGTAGLDFNVDPTQGIGDALLSPERVDDVYLDRLLSKCAEKLSLLAAPASLDRTFELDEGALDNVVDTMRAMVPVVVLDVPHGWSAWIRRTLRTADEVVLVAAPDLASLRNAKNLADFLRHARPNDAPPRLVLNMVGMPKRPEIKADEFARALEMPIAASIPFDPALFGTAANNGQMIAESDPRHAVGETFRSLGMTVLGRAEAKKQKKSALAPLLAKLRGKSA